MKQMEINYGEAHYILMAFDHVWKTNYLDDAETDLILRIFYKFPAFQDNYNFIPLLDEMRKNRG